MLAWSEMHIVSLWSKLIYDMHKFSGPGFVLSESDDLFAKSNLIVYIHSIFFLMNPIFVKFNPNLGTLYIF